MRPTEIDPARYSSQLAQKASDLKLQFDQFNLPELEIFQSPPLHYRMRAEFRIWHQGDDLYHIMFDQETNEKYRVDAFPPANKTINQMMATLLDYLKVRPILRHKLFQIDYLSGLSEEITVTLAYHKPLDDEWLDAANQLITFLSERFQVSIIGRARKQKLVLGNDFIIEQLPIADKPYRFKHVENSFTQPNAEVNCKMIEWAMKVGGDCSGDLLELYCGLGNFSIPLASRYNKVLATEISKTSVAAAQDNIEYNRVNNLKILRMSSEEFVQASRGERSFRRLQGVELSEYDCRTVLVDPPRAGLDDDTVKMVKDYDNIIYISCNPETLKNNLDILTGTHDIKRFALFDQFPYTHHAECGMFLQKRAP